MSTARPKARIKARTPEEFERWRRLAEKRQDRHTPHTAPTNVTPTTEVKK
jgi:hypothetical protein